jgi:hypothetical protein
MPAYVLTVNLAGYMPDSEPHVFFGTPNDAMDRLADELRFHAEGWHDDDERADEYGRAIASVAELTDDIHYRGGATVYVDTDPTGHGAVYVFEVTEYDGPLSDDELHELTETGQW